jgi:hypothetical protein
MHTHNIRASYKLTKIQPKNQRLKKSLLGGHPEFNGGTVTIQGNELLIINSNLLSAQKPIYRSTWIQENGMQDGEPPKLRDPPGDHTKLLSEKEAQAEAQKLEPILPSSKDSARRRSTSTAAQFSATSAMTLDDACAPTLFAAAPMMKKSKAAPAASLMDLDMKPDMQSEMTSEKMEMASEDCEEKEQSDCSMVAPVEAPVEAASGSTVGVQIQVKFPRNFH